MIRVPGRILLLCLLFMLFVAATDVLAERAAPAGQAMEKSGAGYRFERGGWKYVHLEGTPQEN